MSRRVLSWIMLLAVLGAAWVMSPRAVQSAAPTELFFSEYIEGSSNNKALEIYNGSGAAIDLAANSYNVQMFFNGNPVSTLTISLAGTVANGDVFVLAQSSASAAILAQADQTNGAGWFNGDDAVVLRKGTTVLDVIGQVGVDPGTEWGAGLVSTADNTLRRKAAITAGDPNGADAFDPATEWDGFATDTFGGLGSHAIIIADVAPSVSSTYPVNGAADFPINANLNVSFSEPVNLTDPWYALNCSTSGAVAAAVSGGPASFVLDPAVSLVNGETCTFTITGANVADQDSDDPPEAMTADVVVGFTAYDVCAQTYTPIYAIQGSGNAVALTGSQTTQGVVVGDYEGASPALRGFFIQDPAGDGDPATSDGIFIFEGSNADTVNLGDVVRVTGNAGENQGQSQISVGGIVNCGSGSVTPTDVTLPAASPDFLERYEGMLVRLPQTLYVTEHFQLGRFGQVVLSSGGRLQQPTNVVAPGAPAQALQAANNLNRIILDDASQAQNPDPILFARGGQPLSASNTLRGGDTATGIVGVLNYTWAGNAASGNAYRVRPINALDGSVNFVAANPRPTSAPAVGGTLRVAGMNTLNLFNTFDGLPDNVDNCTFGLGGAPTDCRGADTQAEFDRQWPKTVAAILQLNPDVLGVNEIENDGYGPDSAIQFLVDRLNDATAPGTYAFIDADAGTGQVNALGTDAIKVGLIYKPGSVTPVGQTAALNTVAFVNGGDGFPRSRPSLAQAFEQNATGARFIVDVNHLKSKGSACDAPDAGDGQGNCNVVRTNAAQELVDWLATDPTGTGDPDVLLIGDYNAYALEDPIALIQSSGYTNLIAAFLGPDAYSYVFDGQWGYLDHAFASSSLTAQVAGVGDYHINSDEPSVLDYNTDFKTANLIASLYAPDEFRVSDHDPVLVGLALNDAPTVDAGGPYSVAEGGSVTVSATGSDPNGDPLTYAWDLDNNGSFETAGQSAVFSAAGIDAPATRTIRVQATDSGGLTASDEATVIVIYNFSGFFSPVSNPPAVNTANSGQTVEFKFSLGGDQGLGVIASATSVRVVCGSLAATGDPEVPANYPGTSGLSYNSVSNQYTLAWKTEKSWANQCRQFRLTLNDGTLHVAYFNFTK
jgi:predicted extracellular nuclease